ncbi:phospholipase D-like domain-containing protein [Herbiconiux sp. YIM B11900]|uniref:phospholipase D-like domain-containing protein n=1 Tax=Herbiconiux sp. YIM B11900 TaxID=3404131 RepID=UPI003F82794D
MSTYFAPDDQTLDVELAAIQDVIDARSADTGTYGDADNPYQIRYAVMSVSDPAIAQRLADARDAGVRVQILEDYRQLDPAYPWLDTDEYLSGRGFSVVPDHTHLTAATKVTANVVGVTSSGFMHLKARLFEFPGHRSVLTGGQNASTEGWKFNEDDLQMIRDDAVFSRYRAEYDAVLNNTRTPNVWDPSAAVNVLFSPTASGTRAGDTILGWLKSENTLIVIMVFSLRDFSARDSAGKTTSLLPVLAERAAAGVPVYVLTDEHQADGEPGEPDDPTEDRLRAAGVHVYEVENDRDTYAAMHTKAAVLGTACPRVITDTANWSTSALGSPTAAAANTESVLFIDSAKSGSCVAGQRYLAQWLKILSRFGYQSVRDDGESDYRTVLARLVGLPGWPGVPVGFTAHGVITVWGEDACVLGDEQSLGDWGRAPGGSVLVTDAGHYPDWTSSAPVSIPLGTWFDWKLAVSAGSGPPVRWEHGGNRSSFAQPPTTDPGAGLTLDATWR